MSEKQIHILISGPALAAIDRLGNDPQLGAVVAREMDEQNQLAIGKITTGHLSGPTGETSLSVRSNTLRKSVRASKAVILGGLNVASSIGSNVRYAGIHEFGYTGDVQVGAHSRVLTKKTQVIFGKRKKKLRGASIAVRAHTRHVDVPARAPFGHGIADHAPDYGEAISNAIINYVGGQNS